ncbi:thioredoxin fold domain-containing protein [Thiorhodococcus mannitoliphagus]|uniref:Thioredoxin fold domain-containing protein n=1 Tax=Thiorhodococcus mannitoliphagus TaxID=329406 RepID=A0A6P1DYU7_9GAMM|nr:thioredoxin fold domain-containing protein [Thiorhodococcus mannitoliphagus]NEX22849.1 thioredoxin fold domain-containing protein [Thiorhodococcus mannitoliphagus]
MIRFLVAVALSVVVSVALAAQEEAKLSPGLQNPGYHEQPAWFKASFLDLREDVAEAEAAGKRLMLYFYQDGCPYCAKLLHESFGDRAIASLAREHFEVIAINLWGDREVTALDGEATTEKAFASALGVQFTPTLLLLDESGDVVLRINGYFPPHRFQAALRYVAERLESSGQGFNAFAAAGGLEQATGQLHEEGGFLSKPLRLAENRAESERPLVVMFEQPLCKACDELHLDILRREPVAVSLSALDGAVLNAFSTERLQTPDGRTLAARDWAKEMGIEYTPSLVFFDADGAEVFRTEGYLKAFHIQGALDYVATGAYRWQPSFQRYLSERRTALEARGIQVDLME